MEDCTEAGDHPEQQDLELIRALPENIDDNFRSSINGLERRYGKAAGTLARGVFNSQYKMSLKY